MKEYRLSFATLYNHENGIVEAVVDAKIELTGDNMIETFNLYESMDPPVEYMISNRLNSYSFSFDAMTKFK